MSETSSPTTPQHPAALATRSHRLPSARASALLAIVMLALGLAVGGAIGLAPENSYAGSPENIVQRLPQLIALLASRTPAPSTPTQSTSVQTPTAAPAAVPPARPAATTPAQPAAAAPSTAATPSPTEPSTPSGTSPTKQLKLPAITNVWLIELAGSGFGEAKAQPAAAPYISGTLLPASTLLSGWSALSASAFASAAALAEPPAPGATPPLLHSIVQPPCPEGAAGAACAPGSPGQLTVADEFLKATLGTITGTPNYREHGLIVITFATVAVASQAGLPASASSATLTYEPPAGVALLSPFAKAGSSTATFNATSPRQSLEKLLH
jgi:hypothetical protein